MIMSRKHTVCNIFKVQKVIKKFPYRPCDIVLTVVIHGNDLMFYLVFSGEKQLEELQQIVSQSVSNSVTLFDIIFILCSTWLDLIRYII